MFFMAFELSKACSGGTEDRDGVEKGCVPNATTLATAKLTSC